MSEHAGFAAVIGIRQNLITLLLSDFPKEIKTSASDDGPSLDLFCDPPKAYFDKKFKRSLIIRLRGWGKISVDALPLIGSMSCEAEVHMTVNVPIKIEVNGRKVVIGLDIPKLEVTEAVAAIFQGRKVDAILNEYLKTPKARGKLADTIRGKIPEDFLTRLDHLYTQDISFLDPFVNHLIKNGGRIEYLTTFRALDGLLNIGIDLREAYGKNSAGEYKYRVITDGRPEEFTDINKGLYIAAGVNTGVIAPMLREMLLDGYSSEYFNIQSIRKLIADNGAELDSFDLTIQTGRLHVDIKADHSKGSVHIWLDVVPQILQHTERVLEDGRWKTIPGKVELTFISENVNVDIEKKWWVKLLPIFGTFFGGIFGIIFVKSSIDNLVNGISKKIYSEADQDFTVYGLDQKVMGAIKRFEIQPDIINIGISVSSQTVFPHFRTSHYHKDIAEWMRKPSAEMSVVIPPRFTGDPYLHVVWEVRFAGSGKLIRVQDLCSDKAKCDKVTITSKDIPADKVADLKIGCRIFRKLGNSTEPFFNGERDLEFYDRVDRTYRFVRWNHYVRYYDIKKGQHPNQIANCTIKYRRSKIHRTDMVGRCAMVSQMSVAQPPGAQKMPRYVEPKAEYTNRLPCSEKDLHKYRKILCDYCFFGTPQSDTPKPLLPEP